MTTILGIDPGVTTGLAYKMPNGSYMTTVLGQYDEKEVWDSITPNIDLVLYEEFKAITISTYGLYTVRVIGGILAICHKLGIKVIRQHPQQRRSFIVPAEDHIRRTKGSRHVVHEVDALSHIFYYEYKNGLREFDINALAERSKNLKKPRYHGL